MSNNLTPYYLASLFPQPVSNISRYNLHNSNDLQTLKARTSLYYHSFLPTAIRGWNNLSKEVKSCDSINSFKKQLKKPENSPKYYYMYIGRRKAQILHTRLRTNCNALNIDLFTRKIADSPLCRCGIFFHCGYSMAQQNVLTNATSALTVPSLRCYMFGNTSLSLVRVQFIYFRTRSNFYYKLKMFA